MPLPLLEQTTEITGVPPTRLAAVGVLASFVYLLEMFVDERLFRVRSDDLIMLGGYVGRGRRGGQLAGLPVHCLNGLLLTLAYAAIGRRRLTTPGWAAGLTFVTAENTITWPLAVLLVRANPARRAGLLPAYNHAVPWLQTWLRHAVFGLVIGSLLPPDETVANA